MEKPPRFRKVRVGLLVLFALLTLLLTLHSASAQLEPRVNITITEFVDKNVSYGRNFVYSDAVDFYTIEGFINVSNPSDETVYDILIEFFNTDYLIGNFTHMGGRNSSQLNGSAGIPITIQIPELRANQSTLLNYTMNSSSLSEPLDLETTYNLAANNFFFRKVLAGDNLTIHQNLTNRLNIGENITNINISMDTQGIIWNSSSTHNFTFTSLETTGDWDNVSNFSARTWYWTPNGGTLASGQTVNITFVVQAPVQTPSTDTYLMLIESLGYQVNFVASNLTLTSVKAMGKANFSFQKRIQQPSTNDEDHNVTWEIRPRVDVPYNIAYNLTEVSFWVTSDLNPNNLTNDTITNRSLNYTYYPNQEINTTNNWAPSAYWYFNYSDGSGGFPPPIVWMKPEFHIINDGRGQIRNQSFTFNSTDLYMKYVYVVAGYWLEVEKNVTSVAEDQYRIYIDVRNIGNGPTPQNLTVTVYDFIPNGFNNDSAITPAPNLLQSVSGTYNGTAMQWDIPQRQPLNASLFAKDDPNGYDRWNATYTVNGTGDYRVSDLYIVGLDPRQVDGAFGSPLIAVISGLQSHSKEILYFSIVLFLIILNTTNLVISTRINKKIDDHQISSLKGLESELNELKGKIQKRKKK